MNPVTKSLESTQKRDFEAILPSIAADVLGYIKKQNLPLEVAIQFENV
jgi:hypothetical protein